MSSILFQMLQDHLHGDGLPKHPAVRRHPKGGVPHGGHRTHVSLPTRLHHHAVHRGPSPDAVLQMLPNVQVTSRGQRSQLPVCFCGVRLHRRTEASEKPVGLPTRPQAVFFPSLCTKSAKRDVSSRWQAVGTRGRWWFETHNSVTSVLRLMQYYQLNPFF